MTSKRDKLQDLRIAAPCRTEWEGMRGDAPDRRFCQACSKHVHDFAELTPREISGLLRASRGQLCARLTHGADGRLVTLPPRALPPQPAPHRLPQLAAAAVLSLLGLGGAACADPVTALAAEAQEGSGTAPRSDRSADRTATDRPAPDRRTGGTRTTLAGTVTREASGEPLAEAEVKIVNLLDRQERTGRTAADGSFAFGALKPGIYLLEASIRGWAAAKSPDVVVVPAGEEGRVALTVPAAVWDRLAAERPLFTSTLGVMMWMAEPLRQVYEESSLVVVAEAGRSVAVPGELESVAEVRTELVIDEVLKGQTGERVIQVVHAAEPGLQPGETVLAFLLPGNPQDRHRTGGYVPADHGFGLRRLSEAELPAYAERVRALSEITRDGVPHPEDLVDWLVATAEDPTTRREAIGELSGLASDRKEGLAATRHTREVRRALADFLAAGGTLASDLDPAVLAAFLTEAQKNRLTHALLQTETLARPDLDLYNIVRPWSGRESLAWLIERIETTEPEIWEARQAMSHIAEELDDESLVSLVDHATDAEVRARFLEALGGRTVN